MKNNLTLELIRDQRKVSGICKENGLFRRIQSIVINGRKETICINAKTKEDAIIIKSFFVKYGSKIIKLRKNSFQSINILKLGTFLSEHTDNIPLSRNFKNRSS